MRLRNTQRLMVMALMVAGLSGCHASPLVSPARLAPVTSQAYPGIPGQIPTHGTQPGKPTPVVPYPNSGRPTGSPGTPKCYPHVPCLP